MDIPDDPDRFEEAIAAFRERVPMTDDEFAELSEALQARAFKVAGVAQADLVTDVFDSIDDAIADGSSFEDFKEDVADKLYQAWGSPSPARLETIFRTNVMTSYSHGRVRMMKHPAVKKSRPYSRFDGIDDSRQSDICAEHQSLVMPLDDFLSKGLVPPLHYNCRSILTPLSEDEAKEEGIDDDEGDLEADEGFGGDPDDPDDWEPDTSDYPDEIAGTLEDRLSDD